MRTGKHLRQRGFTYMAALMLVMLIGLALAGASQAWSVANQRERERELLWVGTQYAQAINTYYLQSPGLRQYPLKLEDLLEDKRFPMPRRHLRRLYPDPITRSADWELIRSIDGRIVGIHSRSEATPWKQADFPLRWEDFKDSSQYAQWRFVANAGLLDTPPPVGTGGAPAPIGTTSPLAPLIR